MSYQNRAEMRERDDFEAESVSVLGTDNATLSQGFASYVRKCLGEGQGDFKPRF